MVRKIDYIPPKVDAKKNKYTLQGNVALVPLFSLLLLHFGKEIKVKDLTSINPFANLSEL
jgi:hypothetical protein